MSPLHGSLLSSQSNYSAQQSQSQLLARTSETPYSEVTLALKATQDRRFETCAVRKLRALIEGYKTRRILKSHTVVSKLRADYSDLLSFAFGLQQELKLLDPIEQAQQVRQVKQLLVQSVKDLNSKRVQFNDSFYEVMANGAKWLEQSRAKELATLLAQRKSKEGFRPRNNKQRLSYQPRLANTLHVSQLVQPRLKKQLTVSVSENAEGEACSSRSLQMMQTLTGGNRDSDYPDLVADAKPQHQNFLKKGDKSR